MDNGQLTDKTDKITDSQHIKTVKGMLALTIEVVESKLKLEDSKKEKQVKAFLRELRSTVDRFKVK